MSLPDLSQALKEFAENRDWDKFHSPKNFACALLVEAGELLDPLQWVGHEESRDHVKNPEVKAYLEKEVGDVLINLLQFARWCDIDVEQAAWRKLEKLEAGSNVERVKQENIGLTRIDEATGKAVFASLTTPKSKESPS